MFIDLRDGSCINASEVRGAKAEKTASGYTVTITLKTQIGPVPKAQPPFAPTQEIHFDNAVEVNNYMSRYFNVDKVV